MAGEVGGGLRQKDNVVRPGGVFDIAGPDVKFAGNGKMLLVNGTFVMTNVPFVIAKHPFLMANTAL